MIGVGEAIPNRREYVGESEILSLNVGCQERVFVLPEYE